MNKRELTPRQVFELASAHMLKQRVKSAYEDASQYICGDGRRCPVGFFMSHDRDPLLEGVPVSDRAVQDALGIVVTPEVLKVLVKLQKLHDDVLAEYWPSRLRSLAYSFKFAVPGGKRKGVKRGRGGNRR